MSLLACNSCTVTKRDCVSLLSRMNVFVTFLFVIFSNLYRLKSPKLFIPRLFEILNLFKTDRASVPVRARLIR